MILAANSHPVGFEAGSPAAVNGAMTRQLDAPGGIFSGTDVEAAVRRPGDRYAPRSRLVSVEQTTNIGGGACGLSPPCARCSRRHAITAFEHIWTAPA